MPGRKSEDQASGIKPGMEKGRGEERFSALTRPAPIRGRFERNQAIRRSSGRSSTAPASMSPKRSSRAVIGMGRPIR